MSAVCRLALAPATLGRIDSRRKRPLDRFNAQGSARVVAMKLVPTFREELKRLLTLLSNAKRRPQGNMKRREVCNVCSQKCGA